MQYKEINLSGQHIEITFPYSEGMVKRVKEIPDRSWDKVRKVWTVPADQWHATKAAQFGKDNLFWISPDVIKLMNNGHKAVEVATKGLYDFQVEGVAFLKRAAGRAVLADDMGCISGSAEIIINRAGKGSRISLKDLYERFNYSKRWNRRIDTYTRSVDGLNLRLNKILAVMDRGERVVLNIKTASGKSLSLTPDHEVYTPSGWVEANTLSIGSFIYVNGKSACPRCGITKNLITYPYAKYKGYCVSCMYRYMREGGEEHKDKDGYILISKMYNHPERTNNNEVRKHRLVMEASMNGHTYDEWLSMWRSNTPPANPVLLGDLSVHHIDGNKDNNSLSNLQRMSHREHMRGHGDPSRLTEFMVAKEDTITEISIGRDHVYDISMTAPYTSFVANGIIVHNCGKTLQALAFASEMNCKKVLVVCPSSVKYKWAYEIERWLPGSSWQVIRNGREETVSSRFTIVSYNVMTNRYSEFRRMNFDLIIADEAHALANESLRTKALRLIPSTYWLGLSGTPFLNRPIELFPILNMINPVAWPNRWAYGNRYCNGHKNYWGGYDLSGISRPEELKQRLANILIRRTKQEVLKELPELTRSLVPVDIKRGEYDRRVRGFDWKNPLESLNHIRQVIGQLKVEQAVELVSDILNGQDEKCIVYCHHLAVLEELRMAFQKFGVAVIQGATSPEERARLINEFQTNKGTRIMLITDAGGEGIDLYRASHVVFVERAWNPGKEEQIEGRCLTADNVVYYLRTDDAGDVKVGITGISNIKSGDLVLTHSGNLKRVASTHSHEHRGLFVSIDYSGWYEPIRCTSDHKIFICRENGNPHWVCAKDVLPGDELILPKYKTEAIKSESFKFEDKWRLYSTRSAICFHGGCELPTYSRGLCRGHYREWLTLETRYPTNSKINGRYVPMPDVVEIDDDLLYLFGWYLAEGWISERGNQNKRLSICGHEKEISILERMGKRIEKLGIKYKIYHSNHSKSIQLNTYSSELANWFLDWFGTGSHNKRIPDVIMSLPKEQTDVVLSGYVDGDGYKRKNQVEWCSASKELCYQMCLLSAKSGHSPTMRRIKKGHYIGGYSTTKDSDEGFVRRQVRKVLIEFGKEDVYDLTIEDDHSFVVGFSSVHNCHRIGQRNAVTAHYLIAKDTIDEDINALIEGKRKLIGQVLPDALDIRDDLLKQMRK